MRDQRIDLVRRQRRKQPLADVGAGVDVDDTERVIGAVPGERLDLAPAHVALEGALGLGAAGRRIARLGEGDALRGRVAALRPPLDEGVRPDGVEPLHGAHVDELVEVALPAAAVVVEEDETATVVDDDPARRQDGRDAAEVAVVELEAGEEADQPKRQPQQHEAEGTGLHVGDAGQMVLADVAAALLASARGRIAEAGAGEDLGAGECPAVARLMQADRDEDQHLHDERHGEPGRDAEQHLSLIHI